MNDDPRRTAERSERGRPTRRAFLRAAGVAGVAAVAGCSGNSDGDTTTTDDGGSEGTTIGNGTAGDGDDELTLADFRGSGTIAGSRPDITAPSIEDLPDLSGELSLYLGGGEGGLYLDLLALLKRRYPDFEPSIREAPSAQLANTLIEEYRADSTRADVFWAVDAGSLGVVAKEGATVSLPSSAVGDVPQAFRPNDNWVGVAGRARSIPYNTDQFSESDIPSTVQDFPGSSALSGTMGWAPSYGSFQSFVTAMRLLRGNEETKQWLRGMLDQNVSEYPNEFLVSNAVADGELGAGFANHYYALRVKAARPDAPIDLAFTEGDAGALINVAGAEIMKGTDRQDLAVTFIRHLLSAEAQEFFATRTFAYPMVPGVPPVGGLPRIDELSPPDIDLTQLSDLQPTLRLMRDVGVL